jgi:hypothetical protein
MVNVRAIVRQIGEFKYYPKFIQNLISHAQ